MRRILGFYRIPSISNNSINAVATFGELPTQDLTFTTEQRNFDYPNDYPNTELVTMQMVDELSQNIQATTALTKKIVSIGDWLAVQHKTGLIPAESGREAFYTALQLEFGDVNWISMGLLKRSNENSFFMPTHVEFIIEDSGYEYYIKVWTAAENFQNEYEPYKILIIPAVDDLQQFITNTVTLKSLLAANTTTRLLERYNALRLDNPETRFDSFNATWVDPNDANSRLTVPFSYIAYGIAGTNIDNIKNAAREYLAANSNYPDWNEIFPSLYEETDFTVIPLWDKISVPETQIDQNLYSSFTSVKGLVNIAYKMVPTSYGTEAKIKSHVDENLELFSTSYRGMMLAVVANPSNLDETIKLSIKYPDYVNTPASSPDYERMSTSTRNFIDKLMVGLERARTLKDSDSVPSGYFRTRRNNLVYLSFLDQGYTTLIMTRASYFAKLAQVI